MGYEGRINMDPAELEAEALGFENDGAAFVEVVNSMRSRVNTLADTWEGQAKEAFVTQFSDLEPGFTATSDLINDIAQQLRDYANYLLESESQLASQIRVK